MLQLLRASRISFCVQWNQDTDSYTVCLIVTRAVSITMTYMQHCLFELRHTSSLHGLSLEQFDYSMQSTSGRQSDDTVSSHPSVIICGVIAFFWFYTSLYIWYSRTGMASCLLGRRLKVSGGAWNDLLLCTVLESMHTNWTTTSYLPVFSLPISVLCERGTWGTSCWIALLMALCEA